MKQVCLLLIAAFSCVNVFSQAAIAKIKYEEAEEAFAAGDYAATVTKLDEAEGMLGQTNPRILYLRIMAQNKLRKTQGKVDLDMIRTLKKNCQDYLVKYETVEGIEDKYKEIYRVSESIKSFPTADKAFANLSKGLPADLDSIALAYYKVKNFETALEWYKKAAAKNDAYAITRVGSAYCFGEGVKEDNVKAIAYFEKSAAMNEPAAMFHLGQAYRYGWGVSGDTAKWEQWMKKCYETALPGAEKGNAYDMLIVGRALGGYAKPDWSAVADWYIKSAAKGNRNAMDNMAAWYMGGYHVEKNVEKAMELYKALAAGGEADAMYSIGYQYYAGNNLQKDLAKAIEWFIKAAEYGDGSSAFYLGYMYANAEGVTQDYTQAAAWYQLGADRNNRSAINNLGVAYENGRGVLQNNAKAIECYERAAALGNEFAMTNMGHIYRDGILGKAVDYAKALSWYKKGADAGKTDAMYNYAKFLEDGKGTTQDYKGAIEWYTKAANKGYKDAFDRLYMIYYYGYGNIKKDKTLAQEWLNKKNALK